MTKRRLVEAVEEWKGKRGQKEAVVITAVEGTMAARNLILGVWDE